MARLLQPAGFRVSIAAPGSRSQASVTAVMTAFTAGLQLAGWSLRAYRNGPWLGEAAAACREAVLGQLRGGGALARLGLSGPLLSAGFFLAALLLPLLVPFNLEAYLKFHYTKTREQTLLLLNVFLKDCLDQGLPAGHIRGLLQGLGKAV